MFPATLSWSSGRGERIPVFYQYNPGFVLIGAPDKKSASSGIPFKIPIFTG